MAITNLILKKIQGNENTNQWISFYMLTASVMLRKYSENTRQNKFQGYK